MKKCVDGRLHERVRFSEKKWGNHLGRGFFEKNRRQMKRRNFVLLLLRGSLLKTSFLGVFYRLRNKERSKESASFLVAFCFFARPFVSFVSHIGCYASSSTD